MLMIVFLSVAIVLVKISEINFFHLVPKLPMDVQHYTVYEV